MDCDRVQELLTEHLDGGLGDGEGRGVELHLGECPRCASEVKALQETLSLLRSLPPEKAPPQLLEGVRQRLAAEAPKPAAGKGLFASARIRIPVEAAAAVLLFLLVYGIQRQFPAADRPAAPPARTESSQAPSSVAVPPAGPEKNAPAEREAPGRLASARMPSPGKDRTDGTRAAAERPDDAAERGSEPPSGPSEPPRTGEDRAETAAASGTRTPDRMEAKEAAGKSSLAAGAPLPAVPATRVSTGAETVAPRAAQEGRSAPTAGPRVFAAPPSRLLRPLPYGREVVLVVATEAWPGIEEQIARIAEGIGGSVREKTRRREAAESSPPEGSVRVHIPSGSEESFFTELRKLGEIPPEGMPGHIDLPPGPAPGVVAYTVRIRVR